jgi:transposase InsO family protein
MHKHTKLLPYQRREAYRRWLQGEHVTDLARHFSVSRETLYRAFRKARLGMFSNFTSTNQRYRAVEYGLRRLSKHEHRIAAKLARKAHRLKRYEKAEPGELVHFDTKKLPLLPGEAVTAPREHLHVAVDDFSRFLSADIFPDKTGYSSAIHLEETRRSFPFPIAATYSDNGPEYRGRPDHPFVALCTRHEIRQQFTRPRTPRTNGKAERVIKTLMAEWHQKRWYTSREERRRFLYAYVRWYNQIRPHQSLGGVAPLDRLGTYLARLRTVSVNNASGTYMSF